ncbi:bifunctional metallophosphatase/5'-nucleotidase [Desulfovibrio sp. OttesenSCG-928-G15]|nr:bifunctional metallophosphatase/5'-nucleotidase [Desulfovibrio sp. OttesenSCG-928-G15]
MPGSLMQHLILTLALFVFACPGVQGAASPDAQADQTEQVRFVLLYTSDTHGHVLSDKDTIGLDLVAGAKKALEPCVLMDAGDFSDGTPMSVLDQAESMVRLMKKTGYFAAAVGNHEFTYGRGVFDKRLAQAQQEPGSMALVSANTVKADGALLVPAFARTEVAGVSLCAFGLTTQDTKTQATPSAVADLDFLDPVAVSRDMVQSLRASGCDLVVALAHIGSGEYVALKSTDIAEAAPGLDIIIDGHSHVELEKRASTGTLVVSPGAHGKKLGRLDVVYDRAKGKIASLGNTLLAPQDMTAFTADAALTAEIAELDRTTEETLSKPVGESLYELEGGKSAVRSGETNLGNLGADCLRAAHGTDLALLNGGNIRASVKAGRVTAKDILSVFPYTESIVSVKVTGAELLTMLEHGLAALPGEDGRFPQVSGLIVHIQANAAKGQRVKELLLSDGNPVDKEKLYTLAVPSYLAEGGDGYTTLVGKKREKDFSSPQQALEQYLQLVGTKEYAPGQPKRLLFE